VKRKIIIDKNREIDIVYEISKNPDNPCAVFFHPDPSLGGNMYNNVVKSMFNLFFLHGFSVLKMNIPPLEQPGKKQKQDITPHLEIASNCIHWFVEEKRFHSPFWLVGVGYGSKIAMQLFMRLTDVVSVLLISPYVSYSDVSNVSENYSSITMFRGEHDHLVSDEYIKTLTSYLRAKKKITATTVTILGASTFLDDKNIHPLEIAVDCFLSGLGY
jgi:alpha/beta superfamily hydrolase